ncbi:MAG: cupin domain-containing protein [Lachnospira sp.]|nr:cupin domain-containing protein [Lachnospira sp.]
MKCMILAGGSGDTLWPLSRKNYPKQFMNIKEGRSMLQETVVRNMPFCDEFIIVTNENYRNIVNGQMKVFQSLKYRVILEGDSKGTAAAMVLGSLFCNQSELVFAVTADNIIEGADYKDAILRGKEVAKSGQICVIGVKPEGEPSRYDCLYRDGEEVMQFITREKVAKDAMASYEAGYLWNSGMFVFRAGDLLNLARIYAPQLYTACRQAKKKVPAIRRAVRFSANIMKDIPRGSIEHVIFRRVSGTRVVEADIDWMDVGDVRDLDDMGAVGSNYVIENNCDNVVVLNDANKKLVVTNDLKDVVVVNTEDAVFVSSVDKIDDVKEIIKDNKDKYGSYFDDNRLSYREWGVHELLNYSEGYKVKKVTVFPGMSMNLHQHEQRSEHWSVVEGVATITLGNETKDYNKYESVFVPIGMKHKVANKTNKNVVIIEVGIGENVSETDMVKIYESNENNYIVTADNPIVKLDPAFKDNLWGGNKLRTVYGKKCEYDIIAESWELSAHPDGQSVIAEGNYKGMLFNDYLSIIGKEALGWKCHAQDRFPVLIKFIDAREALSIQIHPDDEYALENENEYGKNEMWYVVDCEPGAYLYCGLSKDVSKKELEERIADNTVTEVLNRIDVNKGDVVMVKAGTIHAIGAGIMICEVQQNSNSTYRMYDYDRRDKYGNLRELHIEKAMDVVDNSMYVKDNSTEVMLEENEHYSMKRLVQCKYFECFKYSVEDEVSIPVDDSSFVSIVFIEGEGTIKAEDYDAGLTYKAGDSFFVRAGKHNIIVKGKGECIVTHV